MTQKSRLSALIAEARALQAAGDDVAAGTALGRLAAEPDLADLGQITSLGLPRRLQALLLRQAKIRGDRVQRVGYQYHLVPPPERLARFATFTLAERQAINAANGGDVPRLIHQIWIGALPVPQACAVWAAHAQANGYGYRLWREADLEGLGVERMAGFRAMLARGDYPGAVDVARYAILERDGGIYLDCDWYPARADISFHDLLPMRGLCGVAEDTARETGMGGLLLANSVIMAPPGHPVFTRLNAILPAVLQEMPAEPAWWSTGPLIFTLVARAGAVTLADGRFVVGTLKQRSPLEAVLRLAETATDAGLLIGWKSW